MNPVDNNVGIRTQRNELDQGTRRSQDVAPGRNAAGATADAADVESRGEAVSFTQTAADLLSLESQLRDLPGIDQERVDSIRQAIDNGTFEIDTNRIVDSLLQSERELG